MLSRRASIRLSAQAVSALVALGPVLAARGTAAAAPGRPFGETLDWETFLVELDALTRTQYEPSWDQAQYVEAVAALLGLVDIPDSKLQALLDRYEYSRRGFPQIRTVHRREDYSVALVQFKAGDTIDLHNHPRMTGVILCLTGSVDIESYNLLDRTTQDGALLLQRVSHERLVPGDHATLTETHGNIHALVAHEWCELLDVFTPPYTADRSADYRWYDRTDAPVEGTDIYAAWER